MSAGSITFNVQGKNQGASFLYDKSSKEDYFNGRVWHSKQSLTETWNDLGITFLEALREFGIDKLKAIVDESGATGVQAEKLKKHAEEIVDCVT